MVALFSPLECLNDGELRIIGPRVAVDVHGHKKDIENPFLFSLGLA
jgi:hypothetical protein